MTVYEYIQQANKEQFRDFCFQLYDKGWNDGANNVDDENWILKCLPDITMKEWEEVELFHLFFLYLYIYRNVQLCI